MSIKHVEEAAREAIGAVIQKGAQSLYNSYIAQKIPGHTSENSNTYLYRIVNGAYPDQPKLNNLKKQALPKSIFMDKMAPYKIEKRPRSQQSNLPRKLQNSKLNKTRKTNERSVDNKMFITPHHVEQNVQKESVKPNFCFKLGCQKYGSMENPENQKKLRKVKIQELNEQQQQRIRQQEQDNQKLWKRKKIQQQIQELCELGLRYGYDDNGDIIAPTEKQLKQIKDTLRRRGKQQPKNQTPKKPINLKYQTLDLCAIDRYNKEQEMEVHGRKRGFVSSKFYKKVKLTDRQYNNSNHRQCTTIPFLNLTSGTTIIEKQKNVVASRSKQPTKTREQFMRESQTCSFKSYLPQEDKSTIFFNTISGDRPFTTANCERATKRTTQTGSMRQSTGRKSILWRPQTTNKTCRLSVNNVELARQFVRE